MKITYINNRALVQSTRSDFSVYAISNLGCFFITRNVSKEIERKKGEVPTNMTSRMHLTYFWLLSPSNVKGSQARILVVLKLGKVTVTLPNYPAQYFCIL